MVSEAEIVTGYFRDHQPSCKGALSISSKQVLGGRTKKEWMPIGGSWGKTTRRRIDRGGGRSQGSRMA